MINVEECITVVEPLTKKSPFNVVLFSTVKLLITASFFTKISVKVALDGFIEPILAPSINILSSLSPDNLATLTKPKLLIFEFLKLYSSPEKIPASILFGFRLIIFSPLIWLSENIISPSLTSILLSKLIFISTSSIKPPWILSPLIWLSENIISPLLTSNTPLLFIVNLSLLLIFISVPSINPLSIFTFFIIWLSKSMDPVNLEIVIADIVPPSTLSPLIWSSAKKSFPSVISKKFSPLITKSTLSIVPPSIFTFVIGWLSKFIGPVNFEIVIADIVPPSTLSPLIWSSAKNKLPSVISNLCAIGTVISTPVIVPSVIFTECNVTSLTVDPLKLYAPAPNVPDNLQFSPWPPTILLGVNVLSPTITVAKDISKVLPWGTVISEKLIVELMIFTFDKLPLFTLPISLIIESSKLKVPFLNLPGIILLVEISGSLSSLIWLFESISSPFDMSSLLFSPMVILVPSINPLSIFTLVIGWLSTSIGPLNLEIVIADIVPPSILSPLIWLSFNTKLPFDIFKVLSTPTVILLFSIVDSVIFASSNCAPEDTNDLIFVIPVLLILKKLVLSNPLKYTNGTVWLTEDFTYNCILLSLLPYISTESEFFNPLFTITESNITSLGKFLNTLLLLLLLSLPDVKDNCVAAPAAVEFFEIVTILLTIETTVVFSGIPGPVIVLPAWIPAPLPTVIFELPLDQFPVVRTFVVVEIKSVQDKLPFPSVFKTCPFFPCSNGK